MISVDLPTVMEIPVLNKCITKTLFSQNIIPQNTHCVQFTNNINNISTTDIFTNHNNTIYPTYQNDLLVLNGRNMNIENDFNRIIAEANKGIEDTNGKCV